MSVFHTARFGDLAYGEPDVITLPEGLVGLPGLRRWILLDMDRALPIKWLQSLDDGDFGLPVLGPEYYAADYRPEMPEEQARRLAAGREGEFAVLVVTTVHPGGARLTGNLAAPVVVHTGSRMGAQVVLPEGSWPLRQEIDYVRFGLAAGSAAGAPRQDRVEQLTAAAGGPVGERQDRTL